MDMLHRDLRAREQEAAAIGDEANSRQLQVCSNPVDVLQPSLIAAGALFTLMPAGGIDLGSRQERVTRHATTRPAPGTEAPQRGGGERGFSKPC